jgi:hypothetical protein
VLLVKHLSTLKTHLTLKTQSASSPEPMNALSPINVKSQACSRSENLNIQILSHAEVSDARYARPA